MLEVKKAKREKGIGKKSDKKKNKTCQPSTSDRKRKKTCQPRGNEEEDEEGEDVLEVKNDRKQKGESEEEGQNALEVKKARKQKGVGKKSDEERKKSKKKTDVNNNSDGNANIDVAAIATNLANNMKELIRPSFRKTQLTLEVLAMTRSIFEGCARIRLPKSDRKKRFGFLIPLLLPPIVALTVVAVESHVLSEETHCPKGYMKFGKKCIPKGLCPTGYVKMNF